MTHHPPLLAGKYRLIEPLGRGAMGVVWSAVNSLTEREVAIKLLANADNEEVRMRLMREARACGRIQHPNVIEIFDVDATEGREPFLVMQLLKGETLSMLLQRETRPEISVALRILRDVARGLAAAHKVDVVHRDLKPANVFLHRTPDSTEPVVKLLDFGVSRISTEETLTLKGLAIGSPAYMAPEQALGQRVDVRTDMWAFGTLTYMVLTGGLPFRGRAPVEYLTAIVKGDIPVLPGVHPAVDRELRDLVARCFERDIERRTITATDCATLADALLKRLTEQRSSGAAAAPELPPASVSSEAVATAVVRALSPSSDGAADDGAVTTNDSVLGGAEADPEDSTETLGRMQVQPVRPAASQPAFHAVRKTVKMNVDELSGPAPKPREISKTVAQSPMDPRPGDAHVLAPAPRVGAASPSELRVVAAASVGATPEPPPRAAYPVAPLAVVAAPKARRSPLLWIVLAVAVVGAIVLGVLLSTKGSHR